MSQFLIDCTGDSGIVSCTFSNFNPPPVLSYYQEHGFSGTTITWFMVILAVLGLALIIGTAWVRYRRHDRMQAENLARINKVVKQCPTCGDKV